MILVIELKDIKNINCQTRVEDLDEIRIKVGNKKFAISPRGVEWDEVGEFIVMSLAMSLQTPMQRIAAMQEKHDRKTGWGKTFKKWIEADRPRKRVYYDEEEEAYLEQFLVFDDWSWE